MSLSDSSPKRRSDLITQAQAQRRAESDLCAYFIEGVDDGWGGTFCKLPAGHDGEHSAHYPPSSGGSAEYGVLQWGP